MLARVAALLVWDTGLSLERDGGAAFVLLLGPSFLVGQSLITLILSCCFFFVVFVVVLFFLSKYNVDCVDKHGTYNL